MSEGERFDSGEPLDVQGMLDSWREQGADCLDPLRFHFMEAVARRAAGHGGDARRVLDARLAKLVASYGDDVKAATAREASGAESRTQAVRGPGPLAGLVDDLGERMNGGGAAVLAGDTTPAASSYPELALLEYFRETWSRLGTKRQLRQSREHVPENAGPLNSSLIVHRTLSLMGEVSPEYLHHFLSYVDALAWTEQATGGDLLLNRDGQRGGGGKKPVRGGSR